MDLEMFLSPKLFDMTNVDTDIEFRSEHYIRINIHWYNAFVSNKKELNKYFKGREWQFGKYKIYGIRYVIMNHLNEIKFHKYEKNIVKFKTRKLIEKPLPLEFEHGGIEIRTGKEEWGAEPNLLYFVIKHGKRLNND